MKKYILSFFLVTLLGFYVNALVFTTQLFKIDNYELRVSCGEEAKSITLENMASDDTKIPADVGAIDLTEYYINGLYHYHLRHRISLPGLTGDNHTDVGTPGYITKTCYYELSCTMYFEEGSSTICKHYQFTHNNHPLGGVECDHSAPEEEEGGE